MSMRLLSSNLYLYPRSLVQSEGIEFGLAQTRQENQLVILAPAGAIDGFDGESSDFGDECLTLCPLSSHNAAALREYLPWLKPRTLGLATSAGMGDRLGIATPGHVRAVREVAGDVAPVFAQQSIREMQRTGRSPQQVMDDAMWGAFEEGWQVGAGSDADHLKTVQDIDACLSAGFTLFTLDPGQYVDNSAEASGLSELELKASRLPDYLSPRATGLLGKSIDIEGYRVTFDKVLILKAATKYGRAIEHIVSMYRHLEQVSRNKPYEVEISMDETDQPTSPAEHIYIASELKRLGVRWVSFAPRFVGSFEKGVEYIGDVHVFEEQLEVHAAVARQFGPYKLSLHSGSDKFSLYTVFMQRTRGLAHLKTAGTSYLEALRTIAAVDTELFQEIYRYALQHFEADKLSYHIPAQLDRAPQPAVIHDWPALLEQFDARQVLHVTFGSVLTAKADDGSLLYHDRIMQRLRENREAYFENLVKHFKRHLEPFSAPQKARV